MHGHMGRVSFARPLKRDAGVSGKTRQVRLERRHVAEGDFIPMPEDAFEDELEIGDEVRLSHVLVVKLLFSREHDGVVVRFEVAGGHARESDFFAGKNNGGATCESWSAMKICGLMLRELGPRSDQAHIAEKDVDKLGQFIQLPAAQERANRSESLVA